jgi:hypothetical protein
VVLTSGPGPLPRVNPTGGRVNPTRGRSRVLHLRRFGCVAPRRRPSPGCCPPRRTRGRRAAPVYGPRTVRFTAPTAAARVWLGGVASRLRLSPGCCPPRRTRGRCAAPVYGPRTARFTALTAAARVWLGGMTSRLRLSPGCCPPRRTRGRCAARFIILARRVLRLSRLRRECGLAAWRPGTGPSQALARLLSTAAHARAVRGSGLWLSHGAFYGSHGCGASVAWLRGAQA